VLIVTDAGYEVVRLAWLLRDLPGRAAGCGMFAANVWW